MQKQARPYLYESDTIEERKTTDNNERVGVENGVDESGIIPESNQQRSEAQETGKQSDKVQDRVLGTDDKGKPELILYKRGYNDTSRRIEQVETRKLEDIYSDEKFKTFKGIVNDSIPAGFVNIAFVEIYSNDTRINEEGYDFEEVFAYDLISGKEKELASLFYDEITEYFNQNNSKDADSTGNAIPKSLLERLKDSIIRNAKGQLIPVYHSTTADFGKFEIGDIGFHFGSYIQAYQRNIDKSNVRYIKAYLDIKNPLVFDSDSMGWNAEQVLQKLAEKGVLSDEEAINLIRSGKSHNEINNIIRDRLADAKYDGIVYKNQYESGYANSYIVFDDSQIIRVEDDTNPTKSNKVLSACEKTIKPEIVLNAELMGMLADKFGDNGIDGLVNEIIKRYNRDKTIGDFGNLFTDGGKEIYDALRNQEGENVNYSYAMESEENYEGKGNLLHDDSEQWYAREYPREQVASLAKAAERGSKTAEERKDFTERLKQNQLEKKVVTDREGNKHTFVEIKSSAWNSQMSQIADYYAQKDVNVHFIKGGVQIAFVGEDRTANAMRIGNDIYISYDNAWYTPEQLSMHEYIHIKYDESPEFQKTVQDILEILPKREYNRIVEKVKKAYGDIIDNPYAYEEELICDVLSGMTPSSLLKSGEIVLKFWARESIDMQGYDASQYAESIDAGGINVDVLDSVGNIPYNEYRQLRDYIVLKNNKGDVLLPTDCKEVGNNFYIWHNRGKMDFIVVDSIPIAGNVDFINAVRSELENGTYRGTENFNARARRIRGGKGSHTVLDGRVEGTVSNGSDDRLSVGQSESNTLGYFVEGSGIEKKINYALSSHDSDVEFWEEWLNLVKEYGAIPKGENPVRDINVPKQISPDKVVSQFARTMLEAGITPDTAVSEFEKRVLDGTMTHEVITNDTAREWAINQIKYHGN